MTVLTLTSRTDRAITVTIAAGGGETAFEVELNRSADFASDDSIMKTGQVVGAVVFDGLPADTVYYIRARATNTNPKGAWSNVILQATSLNAVAAGFVGYSILPAILVVPEPIDTLATTNAEAGSSVDNLLNDDPLSTLRTNGGFALTFHTGGRQIDTFALLGTLANEFATIRIRGADTAANVTAAPGVDTGTVQFRTAAGMNHQPHFHALKKLAAIYTHPWWRIDVATAAPQFIVRHLVVGLARQSVNYSRGAGRTPFDMSSFARTQYGAPSRVEGWRGRTIDFELSWLSEAEYQTKWSGLDQLVGTSKPVLAVPNSKENQYLNDRIAFGTISSQRAENVRDAKWSKQIEIQSLY